MILGFVMGALLILPGAGELAAAADFARLGKFLGVSADAGNAGLAIYGIAEDPKSAAVMALFGLLGGTRGNQGAFEEASAIRRSIPPEKLVEFGPKVKDNLEKVASLKASCVL
jgi:hypothetical protein